MYRCKGEIEEGASVERYKRTNVACNLKYKFC